MRQHFMMFAAYNQWANGRIYDAAAELDDEEFNRDVGAFFGSMMGTLNHLLTADRIW
ncbi:DinB family protein, partial [Mesorhizobium sp. M7A.F.Ca.ET.027.03.2.1]